MDAILEEKGNWNRYTNPWNFIKGIGFTTQQLPTSVCTPNGAEGSSG